MNRWLGICIGIGIALYLLTFIPLVTRIERTDKSRIDILLHNGFMEDYQTYLATITQGQSGSFFASEPFYRGNTKPYPLFTLFSIAGRLSKPFHIWPPHVYHLLRGIGVVFVICSIYFLMKQVSGSSKMAAVGTGISLFAANPPDFFFRGDIASSFTPWWNGLSMYGRINVLPHHLYARALLTLAIATYCMYYKKGRYSLLYISVLLCALSVYTVPQTVIAYMCVFGTGEAVRFFKHLIKRTKDSLIRLGAALCALVFPILAVAHVSSVTGDAVWKANRLWEIAFWNRDPWAYYHGYISMVILLVPALVYLITSHKNHGFSGTHLLLAWVVSPLIAYPLLPLIGIGTGRLLLQTNMFIPLSALTMLAVGDLSKFTFMKRIVLPILFASCLLFGVYDTWKNISKASAYVRNEPISDKYYIPKSLYEAAVATKQHIPSKSIVLATPQIGSLIEAFAPVYMYIGRQIHGSNWDIDTSQIDMFLNGQMNSGQALLFLRSHDVEYIVYDRQWRGLAYLPYPFVQLLWENPVIRLYKVERE